MCIIPPNFRRITEILKRVPSLSQKISQKKFRGTQKNWPCMAIVHSNMLHGKWCSGWTEGLTDRRTDARTGDSIRRHQWQARVKTLDPTILTQSPTQKVFFSDTNKMVALWNSLWQKLSKWLFFELVHFLDASFQATLHRWGGLKQQ